MFKLYDFVKRHENLVIKNSPSKRPFSERRQTLFGSLLGDGSLVKKSEKSYCYAECHAKKQAFYLIWKMFMGFLENQTVRKVVGKGNRQDQLYLRGKICVYRRHDKIHGLFYKKSSKPKRRFIKNPELRYILPRLDPLGLAVWYCDDGSYSRGQKTSFLHTNGFSYEKNEIIKDWLFDKFGIEATIIKDINKQFYIRIRRSSTDMFLGMMKNAFLKYEIPRCMWYKLGHVHDNQ